MSTKGSTENEPITVAPRFTEEKKGIYRLRVPFDDLYTSVFLVETEEKRILIDCATTADDVDGYILPALAAMGYSLADISFLVVTHGHADHAGGLGRVREIAPSIAVVTDARPLADGICTYALAGHTADFIGVLDERTHTLISGDGLQGAGVGKYRCSVVDKTAYLKTIEKLRHDERIENLLFSHAYEPWYENHIWGRESVLIGLTKCTQYV